MTEPARMHVHLRDYICTCTGSMLVLARWMRTGSRPPDSLGPTASAELEIDWSIAGVSTTAIDQSISSWRRVVGRGVDRLIRA